MLSRKGTDNLPGALLAVFFLAATIPLLSPSAASAQEESYGLFERAKNAYERGDYEEAVSRFNALLESDLQNPALILECHKLIAVSYLFVDDREMAEKHFIELLTMAPDYDLDPMMFPIEVVDFFTEIKEANKKRIKALAQARAVEEKKRREAEEERRREELERLKRNVYLERSRKQNSLIVAMVPFGAGQFQNGHTVKGALFLSGELILTASAVTTYFLHESLRPRASEPFESSDDRERYERLELSYRIANQASLVGLAALAVTGIIEALYNYSPETVEWKKVDEHEVPGELRPGKTKPSASIAPSFGENSIGLEIIGRF